MIYEEKDEDKKKKNSRKYKKKARRHTHSQFIVFLAQDEATLSTHSRHNY
jgi:hypothetical protein